MKKKLNQLLRNSKRLKSLRKMKFQNQKMKLIKRSEKRWKLIYERNNNNNHNNSVSRK